MNSSGVEPATDPVVKKTDPKRTAFSVPKAADKEAIPGVVTIPSAAEMTPFVSERKSRTASALHQKELLFYADFSKACEEFKNELLTAVSLTLEAAKKHPQNFQQKTDGTVSLRVQDIYKHRYCKVHFNEEGRFRWGVLLYGLWDEKGSRFDTSCFTKAGVEMPFLQVQKLLKEQGYNFTDVKSNMADRPHIHFTLSWKLVEKKDSDKSALPAGKTNGKKEEPFKKKPGSKGKYEPKKPVYKLSPKKSEGLSPTLRELDHTLSRVISDGSLSQPSLTEQSLPVTPSQASDPSPQSTSSPEATQAAEELLVEAASPEATQAAEELLVEAASPEATQEPLADAKPLLPEEVPIPQIPPPAEASPETPPAEPVVTN